MVKRGVSIGCAAIGALLLMQISASSAWARSKPSRPVPTKPASVFEYEKLPGSGALYAVFRFGRVSEIKSFELATPRRMVIDVIGARLQEKKVEVPVNTPGVQTVRLAQFSFEPDIVRIVLDLGPDATLDVRADTANGQVIIQEESNALKVMKQPEISREAGAVVVDIPFAKEPKYTTVVGSNPPRVVVEVAGVRPQEEKTWAVRDGVVASVTVKRATKAKAAQVVVATNITPRYEVGWVEGNRLRIVVHQPALYGRTIVVDPGHGGKDPGAMGPDGVQEKDVVLDIGTRLARLLRAAGARVIMTRSRDEFIPLEERSAIANRAHADFFIAVHINAMPRSREDVRGTQTYYFDEANKPLADIIQANLTAMLGSGDAGVFSRRFSVIRRSVMPAVLCEIGYVTNPADRTLLLNPAYRENAARGIFNGVEGHLGDRAYSLNPVAVPESLLALSPRRPVCIRATGGGVMTTDENMDVAAVPDEGPFPSVEVPLVRQAAGDIGDDELEIQPAGRTKGSPGPQPFRKSAPDLIGDDE
jgi:N-acetylmuramoyl-L-alanine amidase